METVVVFPRQFNQQVQALTTISRQPTLQALAYALRNPDVWPQGFTWNYRRTEQCAIGLAGRLWPEISQDRVPTLTELQNVFAISPVVAFAVFIGAHGGHFPHNWMRIFLPPSDTTPEQVATMIDTYLSKGEMPVMLNVMGF